VARQIADENLPKPDISAAVSKAMAERSRRTGINADRVLTELAKIGFANITDAMKVSTASREDTTAIQSIWTKRIPTENGDIVEQEIKMHDKLRALEQLGRHLGLFNDKLKLDGGVSVVIHEDLKC
jgi:phage terminase small subunit